MTPRARKLIGSFGILIFMTAYIWLGTIIAEKVPAHPAAQILFFAVAGIGWGFPLFPFIAWMNRAPDGR